MADLRVGRSLTIPRSELRFRFSTSGGPGGQHSNKVATRVEISWNVARSRAVGPVQRSRLLTRLTRRIDHEGDLRVVSDRFRSQARNRDDALEKLRHLVAGALKAPKRRAATEPTKASKERRLQTKRQRAEIKRTRQKPEW